MTIHTKRFGYYRAVLDTCANYGDGPTTECQIQYQGKHLYTASLECLRDTGELNNALVGSIGVDQHTIADIEEWALENGY